MISLPIEMHLTFVIQYMQPFLAETCTPQYHHNKILSKCYHCEVYTGIVSIVYVFEWIYLLPATWSAYTNVTFNSIKLQLLNVKMRDYILGPLSS